MPKHENNGSNGPGRHVEISLGLSVQLVDERTLNGENPFNGGSKKAQDSSGAKPNP